MKHTISQVFHSPKFLVGFIFMLFVIGMVILYPVINPGDPLAMIGLKTFARPGTYVNVYDSVNLLDDENTPIRAFKIEDADTKRMEAIVTDEIRVKMINWFVTAGVDVSELDATDKDQIIEYWFKYYDESITKGFTKAARRDYRSLNNALIASANTDPVVVATESEDGTLTKMAEVQDNQYVRTGDVANVITLPLGTDNFGRDVLKELVSATGTSLLIGLIAGSIATAIGLLLGLLSGYVGGFVDELIMFFTNIFTVIPGFVLLILISYSLGQEQRGAMVVAIVIGLTSWPWTCRSVRSQVISLRNRDHVNLSKLSEHSLIRIIVSDILPYIASYVVMAFILQVSSGILSEAQLSLLGLGPKTTTTPTLGLMMNWSMLYSAHTNGSWWAYFPVIFTIAGISFSLNLMNTGLDQVFNPTLRD